MSTVLAMVICGALTVWIVLPLRHHRKSFLPLGKQTSKKSLQEVREEKASVMLALRELDFDYETGKLSPQDYKALREKYQARAVEIFKQFEALEKEWTKVQAKIDQKLGQRDSSSPSPSEGKG